jgi:8-oxo-dGTP diphosphatase
VPIGWEGFAARVEGTRVPVYALGGLDADDLLAAIAHGAQGVALRRAAWPCA